VRVYLRSHAGENQKGRPGFYDKALCLLSLGRAAEEMGPEVAVTFVNDGPLHPERERLMTRFGEVVQIDGGSNRASYRRTLALAAAQATDDVDVIWFGEDDYLYRPEAFRQLALAAETVPAADYFALYCGELGSPEREVVAPTHERGDKVLWQRGSSTTSSFAVRPRQLREDLRLLRLMPYTGGAFDLTTCLTLQGQYPFPPSRLRRDLLPLERPVTTWPRFMVRGAVRTVLGTRALRRPERRRTFYAPDRDLVTHLEDGCFDPVDAWDVLAEETRAWAEAEGLLAAGTGRHGS
jgi:hypothetical protein